jgi:cytochrome c oxidase subunit 3
MAHTVDAHEKLHRLGDPPIIHHCDSVTAYEGSKLGMWMFLATEILLFAVMFAAFIIFRSEDLEIFHKGSHHLDWRLGALNTVILLLSSFTAALSVDAAQRDNQKGLIRNLVITIGCGGIFLVIKSIEYLGKYQHGLFPGGEHFNSYKAFMGLYFSMTGIHGLHVIIGMSLLGWVLFRASRGHFSSRYYTPIEMSVLYWHLVDLIWIYLFPLLYLVG